MFYYKCVFCCIATGTLRCAAPKYSLTYAPSTHIDRICFFVCSRIYVYELRLYGDLIFFLYLRNVYWGFCSPCTPTFQLAFRFPFSSPLSRTGLSTVPQTLPSRRLRIDFCTTIPLPTHSTGWWGNFASLFGSSTSQSERGHTVLLRAFVFAVYVQLPHSVHFISTNGKESGGRGAQFDCRMWLTLAYSVCAPFFVPPFYTHAPPFLMPPRLGGHCYFVFCFLFALVYRSF